MRPPRSDPRRPARPAILLALAATFLAGCSVASVPPSLSGLPRTLAELAPERSSDATPRGETLRRPARLRPYTLDLYREGDHVAQYHGSWCVGASMQMMINMIEDGRPDRSRRTQKAMYDLARDVSPWEERRPGASTYGWAGGLTELGHGPYVELSAPGKQWALRIAARQMRYTRKPVGLLVWSGRHAWVMSGFRATADPAYTDDFEVTHVYIEDPWAGRSSPAWGRGLDPHSLVRVSRLSGFTRWSSHHRPEYGRDGHYVIVAPLLEGVAEGMAAVAGGLAPAA
jgi:hypothetical protein